MEYQFDECILRVTHLNGKCFQNEVSSTVVYDSHCHFQQVILALGDYMSIQCHACIGGTNVGEDIRKLDYGQHVVSGTPGRVFGKLASSFGDGCK